MLENCKDVLLTFYHPKNSTVLDNIYLNVEKNPNLCILVNLKHIQGTVWRESLSKLLRYTIAGKVR